MTRNTDDLALLAQELIDLGRHLHRAISHRAMPAAEGEESAPLPQRNGQWRVLGILHTHGPQTMNDLALRMDVAPPTVTGIVRGLVERGLVQRGHDADDWRVVRITITGAGREEHQRQKRFRRDLMVRVLADLDDADVRRLTDAIPAIRSLEAILDPGVGCEKAKEKVHAGNA